MKNVLERNLLALKEHHPQLFATLDKLRAESEPSTPQHLQVLFNSDEQATNLLLWQKFPEWIGQLHEEDARIESKKIVSEIDGQPAQLLLILGQGIGALLKDVLNLKRRDIHGHLIVEKNPQIFLKALETFDFTEAIGQPERFYWLIGKPENQLESELMNFLSEFNTVNRSIKILGCPRILEIESNYYIPLVRKLIGLRDQVTLWSGTSVPDSFRGLQNLLRNLPHLLKNPGIKALKNRFQGGTCVSVAAGPSLNEAWDQLKEISGKIPIIACDTLLKPMNDHEIAPHYITALERDQVVADFFKNQKVDSKTSLVASNLLLPEAFENFNGQQYIYCPPLTYSEILGCKDLGILESGSSAGNLNLALAAYLGFKKVIMIGHNLAFAPETFESHVKGTIDPSREKTLSPSEIKSKATGGLVPTADGQSKVFTILEYNLFRFQMERFIAGHPDIEFINTAAKGAAIDGASFLNLNDAIHSLGHHLQQNSAPQLSLKSIHPENEPRLERALKELIDFIQTLKEMDEQTSAILEDLIQWESEIELAEKTQNPWSLEQLDLRLDQVLELKLNYAQRNEVSSRAFLSVIAPAITAFERCLNEMPLKEDSNYKLKKKFLLEHKNYFQIWKTWLPQVICEYEYCLSRLKKIDDHSWTSKPASPVAT